MTLLEIALLQANTHGQDLSIGHLRPLGPLVGPMGQMSFMKAVRDWDLTLDAESRTLDSSERTGYGLEHEATGQDSYD
jgi:hypothetical protein